MTVDARSRRSWALVVVWISMAWAAAKALSLPEPPRASRSGNGGTIRVGVAKGHAFFDLPVTAEYPRWLVVVSNVSTKPVAIPLTLRVSETTLPGAVTLASPEPRRPPNLSTYVAQTPPPAPRTLPVKERTFSLMVRAGDPASASNYLPVRAKLRATGRGVQVYVDERERETVSEATISEIVRTFDDEVLPTSARSRGVVNDTDGDGRFTVLLSGWLARLGGGRLAVDGFIRGADLDPAVSLPFGNQCDMLYLSSTIAPGPFLKTVLAHEYAHAVTFSHKLRHRPAAATANVEEEGWLDEAISHLVEDQHGYSRANLDYRVDAFLAAPERYSLVVDDYFRADLFRSHGHRGATYLFLKWCESQFGPKLVPSLMGSPLRGIANLENATGRRFADLYRDWSLSLVQKTADNETQGPGSESPRRTLVSADDPPESWDASGTTSRYFVLESPRNRPLKILVDAPEDAEIQVSAVPIAANQAFVAMTARRRGRGLAVDLRHRCGPAVIVDSLEWCDRANPATTHAELRGGPLSKAIGNNRIPEGGSARLNAIPVNAAGAEWVFKMSGHDASGKPVTSWALCRGPGIGELEADHASDGEGS